MVLRLPMEKLLEVVVAGGQGEKEEVLHQQRVAVPGEPCVQSGEARGKILRGVFGLISQFSRRIRLKGCFQSRFRGVACVCGLLEWAVNDGEVSAEVEIWGDTSGCTCGALWGTQWCRGLGGNGYGSASVAA